MVGCSIRNCKNRSKKGGTLQFFSFPRNEEIAKQWLGYCGSFTTIKNARVCSSHFTISDYLNPLQQQVLSIPMPKHVRHLKSDALPSLRIDDDAQNSKILKGTSTAKITNGSAMSNNEKHSFVSDNSSHNDGSCSVEVLEVVEPHDDNAKAEKERDIHIVNLDQTDRRDIGTSDIEIRLDEMEDEDDTAINNNSKSSKINDIRTGNMSIPVAEYKLLKKKYNEYHVLMHNLEQIFTPGQIHCLTNPYRHRVQWSKEDMSAAISLRKVSPAGYRYLRATVGIPLPGFSTMRKWAAKHGVDLMKPDIPES